MVVLEDVRFFHYERGNSRPLDICRSLGPHGVPFRTPRIGESSLINAVTSDPTLHRRRLVASVDRMIIKLGLGIPYWERARKRSSRIERRDLNKMIQFVMDSRSCAVISK